MFPPILRDHFTQAEEFEVVQVRRENAGVQIVSHVTELMNQAVWPRLRVQIVSHDTEMMAPTKQGLLFIDLMACAANDRQDRPEGMRHRAAHHPRGHEGVGRYVSPGQKGRGEVGGRKRETAGLGRLAGLEC